MVDGVELLQEHQSLAGSGTYLTARSIYYLYLIVIIIIIIIYLYYIEII